MCRLLGAALILALGFAIAGCSTWMKDEPPLYVGVSAPEEYEMWVVHLQLEKPGARSWWFPVGSVSCCWIGEFGPRRVGGGEMSPFPSLIALHWFSFAEQKFYFSLIRVPESLQDRMRKPAEHSYPDGTTGMRPRSSLVLGLAPGGQVVMWMMSQRSNAVEAMRVSATEVDGDPNDFASATASYLEEHGSYLK
ncbi:hypothetical protein Q672_00465 [Marinobacter sp. EVN1]|uniref:DUF2931 family protein n=1 Tax=Marinobacter sp. EVN1 TaxID=1397532 RepID=UPI0003B85E6A|nr:DUF2931 family protein [Marinobacter sp. EVN1]ERS88697.1 hypothetical protein Q672_00465 [Marinobacter sp. EVN1]